MLYYIQLGGRVAGGVMLQKWVDLHCCAGKIGEYKSTLNSLHLHRHELASVLNITRD